MKPQKYQFFLCQNLRNLLTPRLGMFDYFNEY